MPNKYKITIKISETETQQKILSSKDEICKALNISISALNNFLLGRTKHKFDYLTIEKITVEDEKKELTDEEKEEKRKKQREANKRFNERRKEDRIAHQKKSVLSALLALP